MANWMGGRLATTYIAASNELERERRYADDRRRQRALTDRKDEDRDGGRERDDGREREREQLQPRGALARAIQPIEQPPSHRRKRRRREGAETNIMDKITTAIDRRTHRRRREAEDDGRGRDAADRYMDRERERDDSRERDGYSGRGRSGERRERGGEGRRRRRSPRRDEWEDGRPHGRRQSRAARYAREEENEEEDEGWYKEPREERDDYGRRRGPNYYQREYSDRYEESGGRGRRERSVSPSPPLNLRSDKQPQQDPLPQPLIRNTYLSAPAHYTGDMPVRAPPRRIEPQPLNAREQQQLQRQQEQQRQMSETERSRPEPVRRTGEEEGEARQTFLSHPQHIPRFIPELPPHILAAAASPPRDTQLTRRRRRSPPPQYSALPPPLRSGYKAACRDELYRRSSSRYDTGAGYIRYSHIRRPPVRTPSPPRTPLGMLRSAQPAPPPFVEEAMFRTPLLWRPDLAHGAYNERVPAARPPAVNQWPQRTFARALPPPVQLPPLSARPLYRMPATEKTPVRQPVAEQSNVRISLLSPSESEKFRPPPAPHMRPNKQDGGHKAAVAQQEQRVASSCIAHVNTAREPSVQPSVEVRQQPVLDQSNNSDSASAPPPPPQIAPQAPPAAPSLPPPPAAAVTVPTPAVLPPPPAPTAAARAKPAPARIDQPSAASAVSEKKVQSSADIERALANCEQPAPTEVKCTKQREDTKHTAVAAQQHTSNKQAVIEAQQKEADKETVTKAQPKEKQTEVEAKEKEKPAAATAQPTVQQSISPTIELDEEAETKEEEEEAEAAGREQHSEAESNVSSHYAYVGPAKFDGDPWVRQVLIDNGIHIVEFDDEQCNVAFLESDYAAEQLSAEPIAASKEKSIIFYDMQYIRDSAIGVAGDLAQYRLSKPSERR